MISFDITLSWKNKTKSHRLLFWMGLFSYSPFAWSVADSNDLLQPFVLDSMTYDSNIYRQSSNASSDFINRASAGTLIHKTISQQIFNVNLQIDDNHYFDNQILNHISSENDAFWGWHISDEWSGKLGASYRRSLAGFANTQFLSPDLLDQPSYYFNASYQLNPHWRFDGGWKMSETLHSAVSRQTQNMESQNFNADVTYLTTHGNSLGIKYNFVDAIFPKREKPLGNQDIAYQENTAKAVAKYNYSPKIYFDAEAGYKYRSYQNISSLDFQGETWRLNVGWSPTVKTLFMFSSWHDLTSFIELASNYYVSEGVSLTPQWMLNEKFSFSGNMKYENQSHVGNDVVTTISNSVPLRQDDLFSVGVNADYSLTNFAKINLSGQFYQRDSNRKISSYVGDSVTATIQLKF